MLCTLIEARKNDAYLDLLNNEDTDPALAFAIRVAHGVENLLVTAVAAPIYAAEVVGQNIANAVTGWDDAVA